jgi:hypothetical protein
MLLPLKPGELQRLIPAVASGPQFSFCSGSPQLVLQRVLISTLGGLIPLLVAQGGFGSRWSNLWLVFGLVMLLYVLWGPIVQAGGRNGQLRKYPAAALFEGQIQDLYTKEKLEGRQETTDKEGRLELVENRRTWLCLELGDEDGYLAQLRFPLVVLCSLSELIFPKLPGFPMAGCPKPSFGWATIPIYSGLLLKKFVCVACGS